VTYSWWSWSVGLTRDSALLGGFGWRRGAVAAYVMTLTPQDAWGYVEVRAGWSTPDQWPDREPKFRAGPVWVDWSDS
jgi:hypothetical protein